MTVEEGTVVIQNSIIQDLQSQEGQGIQVEVTGEVAATGTTIRRFCNGLFVWGKATLGKGCSITGCPESGINAWKQGGDPYPAVVTVEEGAGLVCEVNNPSSNRREGDYLARDGAAITGVAEEKIVRADE